MENKPYSIEEIVEIVNKLLNQAEKVNCFTRSEKLQQIEIDNINQSIPFIRGFIQQAIDRKSETIANDFFKMQCILNAYKSTLECWITIKKGEFQPAWSLLIDAQEYCDTATRIFSCQATEHLTEHLKSMERSIFPSFAYYNSIGVLETPGNCSICKKPFNDCEHIENGIYSGRLCRRLDRDIIELNHSALVEKPYDRRCIFTEIEVDGVMVDNFTREPVEVSEDKVESEDKEGMRTKAILFNNQSLDYN